MRLFTSIVLCLALTSALSSCYITPKRHLASDIILVQVGKSTREDVLIYLGDPDDQKVLEGGVEKWLYTEMDANVVEKTPLVGKYFGSPEIENVIITFTNGIVSDTAFSATDKDELDWADDYSWQKN